MLYRVSFVLTIWVCIYLVVAAGFGTGLVAAFGWVFVGGLIGGGSTAFGLFVPKGVL